MGVQCSKQPELMPIILEEDEIELSSVSTKLTDAIVNKTNKINDILKMKQVEEAYDIAIVIWREDISQRQNL